jgi:hypothetical protein
VTSIVVKFLDNTPYYQKVMAIARVWRVMPNDAVRMMIDFVYITLVKEGLIQ